MQDIDLKMFTQGYRTKCDPYKWVEMTCASSATVGSISMLSNFIFSDVNELLKKSVASQFLHFLFSDGISNIINFTQISCFQVTKCF